MKKTFTFIAVFLLLLFCVCSCRRQEIEYGVVAEFPPFFSKSEEKCRLIITDQDNNILIEKEILNFTGKVFELSTLRLKNPIEVFNAHFVFDLSSGGNKKSVWVFSHLGLKNSGSFRFFPDRFTHSPPPTKPVIIDMGPYHSQYEYHFVGVMAIPQSFPLNTVHKIFMQEGQGLVIIRTDNKTNKAKSCYLPSEMVQDTITVDSSRFMFPPRTLDFTTPILLNNIKVKASAFSADKKQFVHLEDNFFGIDNIAVPNGIPSDWRFYFTANTFPNRQIEKETPSDIITVDNDAQISLKTKNYQGGVLSLQCSDNVDWLRTTTNLENPEKDIGSFIWNIEGHPDQFKGFRASDLIPHLNDKAASFADQFFKIYGVTLIHSGEFGYEDMLQGMPWTTGDPFRNGKKGFEIVQY